MFCAKRNIPFPSPRTAEPEAPPVLHPDLWRERKSENIVTESLSLGDPLRVDVPTTDSELLP